MDEKLCNNWFGERERVPQQLMHKRVREECLPTRTHVAYTIFFCLLYSYLFIIKPNFVMYIETSSLHEGLYFVLLCFFSLPEIEYFFLLSSPIKLLLFSLIIAIGHLILSLKCIYACTCAHVSSFPRKQINLRVHNFMSKLAAIIK